MSNDPSILDFFESIEDPRREHGRLHPLSSILYLSLTAVLCGAESFREIAIFGHHRRDDLEKVCEFPHGIPSHDTIGRVFALLDKVSFQEAFTSWVDAWKQDDDSRHIAIDGKRLKGSEDSGRSRALHLVNAFCTSQGLVLGQCATDSKSNEITAIPQLLERLFLNGAVVSIDAMGCQRNIAASIRHKQGDYLFGLKGNQGNLHEDVREFFHAHEQNDPTFENECDFVCSTDRKVEVSRGREESRRVVVTSDFSPVLEAYRAKWKDLRSVVMIEREIKTGTKVQKERSFYITSCEADANRIQKLVRDHWKIENSLHWVLDVVFDEDRSRARATKNAAANMALIRQLCINLIKKNKKPGDSIRGCRKKCGWNNQYMIQIIKGNQPPKK